MTAILQITDEAFEDGEFFVVGETMEVVGKAAADYLRCAAPVNTMTGERIEVPDTEPAGGWWRWCWDVAQDCDWIGIDFFSSEEKEVLTASELGTWLSFNGDDLRRVHAPAVETIKTQLL